MEKTQPLVSERNDVQHTSEVVTPDPLPPVVYGQIHIDCNSFRRKSSVHFIGGILQSHVIHSGVVY